MCRGQEQNSRERGEQLENNAASEAGRPDGRDIFPTDVSAEAGTPRASLAGAGFLRDGVHQSLRTPDAFLAGVLLAQHLGWEEWTPMGAFTGSR